MRYSTADTMRESMPDGIAEISQTIMEDMYCEDVLRFIISSIAAGTGAQFLLLFLYDEKKKKLVRRAAYPDGDALNQLPPGENIAQEAAEANAPLTVPAACTCSRLPKNTNAKSDNTMSLLSAPMNVEEEVIGVVNWYKSAQSVFSRKEIQTLTIMANQAAVVLRDTELRIMKTVAEQAHEEHRFIKKAERVLAKKKSITQRSAFDLIRYRSENSLTSMGKIAESFLLISKLS